MPPHSTYTETHLGDVAITRNKRPAPLNGASTLMWKLAVCQAFGVCRALCCNPPTGLGFFSGYVLDGREPASLDPLYVAATTKKANFEFSSVLHDCVPVGGCFRERKRIRPKTRRWVQKLCQMPDIDNLGAINALIQSSDIQPDYARELIAGRKRGVAA